jgi:hypothetical protein
MKIIKLHYVKLLGGIGLLSNGLSFAMKAIASQVG